MDSTCKRKASRQLLEPRALYSAQSTHLIDCPSLYSFTIRSTCPPSPRPHALLLAALHAETVDDYSCGFRPASRIFSWSLPWTQRQRFCANRHPPFSRGLAPRGRARSCPLAASRRRQPAEKCAKGGPHKPYQGSDRTRGPATGLGARPHLCLGVVLVLSCGPFLSGPIRRRARSSARRVAARRAGLLRWCSRPR